MFHNKISVFSAYAAIAIVGFGGVALLNFAGKSADNNALVAFLGFYGFFCTTAIFYVLGKQKAALDTLVEHINEVSDAHYKNADAIHRRVDDGIATIERDMEKRMDAVWVNIDRIDNTLDECASCTPSKK